MRLAPNHAPLVGFCTGVGYVLIALHGLIVGGCYDGTAAICALFSSDRLDKSETLLCSFTQERGIEADFSKDPMSAMSEMRCPFGLYL